MKAPCIHVVFLIQTGKPETLNPINQKNLLERKDCSSNQMLCENDRRGFVQSGNTNDNSGKKKLTEQEILNCIDRGMDAYGESFKQVIYFKMRQISDTEREGMLRKPQGLAMALDDIFGAGGKSVERAIVREIRSTFAISRSESDSLDITSAVRQERRIAARREDDETD